eukprot:COSAG01_NODE_3397_length_6144_cov_33.015550_1_plen_72_part_00
MSVMDDESVAFAATSAHVLSPFSPPLCSCLALNSESVAALNLPIGKLFRALRVSRAACFIFHISQQQSLSV